ncbi:MAG: orotate phosphoribosyltransferase [Candidatus Thorarchaeota archaeon]
MIRMTPARGSKRLKQEILADIYNNRMILTSLRDRPEGWKLHSGRWSPFYIQLRLLCSYPETLQKVGRAVATMIEEEAPDVTRLVGIAFAGVPIATAVSLASGLPAVHTRKLVGVRNREELLRAIEQYGQHTLLEGVVEEGDRLCLVDDLVTGMESKTLARQTVMSEVEKRGLSNVTCDTIAVVLDRQQGARARARDEGMRLLSLIDFIDEGLPLLESVMSEEEIRLITGYLTGSQ